MLTLPLLLLLSLDSHAAAKPVCDSKAVTRNCEYFHERKNIEVITLPDGSTIKNPMYKPPEEAKVGGLRLVKASPLPVSAEQGEDYLSNQARVIDTFRRTPFTTRFKLAYLRAKMNAHLNSTNTIKVPWPPDESNAKIQELKIVELENFLKKNLSKRDYTELGASLTALNRPAALLLENERKRQAQKIAADKALAEKQKLGIALRAKKKARISELFKYTQETVIQTIQRGKSETQLSAGERSLILKVRTLSLAEMDTPDLINGSVCADNSPNAFYDPLSHSINVCSGHVMKSDADLVAMIGHEIGHSIDPCKSSMPFWEVDAKKLEEFMKSQHLSADHREEIEAQKLGKSRFINFDLSLFSDDQELVNKLIAAGVLKKLADGTNDKNYPFNNERRCLVNKNSIKENTKKDISESVAFFRKHINEKGYLNLAKEKSVERYSKALTKYPQCLKTAGPATKINESVSDVFGAVVAEKFILEHPFKTEDEKVASMPYAHSACEMFTGKEMAKSYAPLRIQTIITSHDFSASHPDNATRVEKLQMNLPGLAKVFGCQRKVAACFDHLSYSTRMGAGSSARMEGRK